VRQYAGGTFETSQILKTQSPKGPTSAALLYCKNPTLRNRLERDCTRVGVGYFEAKLKVAAHFKEATGAKSVGCK